MNGKNTKKSDISWPISNINHHHKPRIFSKITSPTKVKNFFYDKNDDTIVMIILIFHDTTELAY